jgi:hypothetical protein
MQTESNRSLAELELFHSNAANEVNDCFKEHGDSCELRTMRVALLHIEERIKETRFELQDAVQEIHQYVADLNSALQVGVLEIKKDVEKLNGLALKDLKEIESEIKQLRAVTEGLNI